LQDAEERSAGNLVRQFVKQTVRPCAPTVDIQLGREDGLSLVRWIRQRQKLSQVPIIAVTAHAMVSDCQRVMEAGCNACLAKPVDFKSLGKQLEQWLKRPAGHYSDALIVVYNHKINHLASYGKVYLRLGYRDRSILKTIAICPE